MGQLYFYYFYINYNTMLRKFGLIAVQGHPRSSILVDACLKRIRNFVLVHYNSKTGLSPTVFEILTHAQS